MSRKIYKEIDGYNSEDLLQSAYHHFAAAQNLLEGNPEDFDSGGYLLHLSVELLLKSWILHVNKELTGTHSLQHLRDQVCKFNPEIKFSKKQNKIFQYLDNLYELRYPNINKPTEIGTEDLELALEVCNIVINCIPEDLYSKYENIKKDKKGGRILMIKPKEIPLDFEFLTEKK